MADKKELQKFDMKFNFCSNMKHTLIKRMLDIPDEDTNEDRQVTLNMIKESTNPWIEELNARRGDKPFKIHRTNTNE